jgi:hypothetical protein
MTQSIYYGVNDWALAALTYVEGTMIIYLFLVGIALLEGAATLNWVMVGDILDGATSSRLPESSPSSIAPASCSHRCS